MTYQRPSTFDLFTAFGSPSFPGFHPGGQLILHFVSPSSAVDSDALPRTAADFVAAFGTGFLFIGANKIGGVSGGFDSFTHEMNAQVEAQAAVVPEPASMILLGTGLLGVVRVARRRRAPGTGAGRH